MDCNWYHTITCNPLKSLLWNEFDRGYFLTPNHYLNVVVEITSPKFWVTPLSQSQKDKYEFIKEKREQKLS